MCHCYLFCRPFAQSSCTLLSKFEFIFRKLIMQANVSCWDDQTLNGHSYGVIVREMFIEIRIKSNAIINCANILCKYTVFTVAFSHRQFCLTTISLFLVSFINALYGSNLYQILDFSAIYVCTVSPDDWRLWSTNESENAHYFLASNKCASNYNELSGFIRAERAAKTFDSCYTIDRKW